MDDWKQASIDSFCNSVRDGTHDSPKPCDTGRYLITSRHIIGGNVDLNKAYLISQEDFDEVNRRSKVDQWDVLITMIGTVGEIYLVKTPPDFAIKNVGLFKSKDELNGKWLYYYLLSPEAQTHIGASKRGTTQPYLPLEELRHFEIKVPTDRSRMPSIVDLLFSLDNKIELNRRTNETLEALAQALFKDWFVDFGPTCAKAEGQPPYLAPEIWELFPDALDDDDKPVGWTLATLGEVSEILDSKRIPLSSREREKRPGPYPYHGAAGVMDYVDDYLFEGVHVLIGEDGSVVKENGKPFTQYIWGKFWVNNHAHVIRGQGVSTEHLLCFFEQLDISPYVTGAVQPKLSQGNLKSIPFINPGKAISEALDKSVDALFSAIRANSGENRILAQLRDLLLPKLMSGEIRLREAEKAVEAVA